MLYDAVADWTKNKDAWANRGGTPEQQQAWLGSENSRLVGDDGKTFGDTGGGYDPAGGGWSRGINNNPIQPSNPTPIAPTDPTVPLGAANTPNPIIGNKPMGTNTSSDPISPVGPSPILLGNMLPPMPVPKSPGMTGMPMGTNTSSPNLNPTAPSMMNNPMAQRRKLMRFGQ